MTRSPRRVVHGVSGAFTLGVLFNLGPRIGKYTKEGLARGFRPNNLHITLLGLMLIFTGLLRLLRRLPGDRVHRLPGLGDDLPQPDDARLDHDGDHLRLRGRLHRGYFASRGDPFWTVSGGLAGVIGVSAGADVYAPTLAYLLAMATAALAVYAGNWIETKGRVDDVVGAVAVHGVSGLPRHHLGRRVRRRLPDRRQQRRLEHLGAAARRRDVRAARLPDRARFASWVLKKLNLLRVPPEVEIAGLDTVEYVPDIYLPEVRSRPAALVEPDGTLVDADPLILEEYYELTRTAAHHANG